MVSSKLLQLRQEALSDQEGNSIHGPHPSQRTILPGGSTFNTGIRFRIKFSGSQENITANHTQLIKQPEIMLITSLNINLVNVHVSLSNT